MNVENQAPAEGDDILEPLIYAAMMHNGTPKTVVDFERAAANVTEMLERRGTAQPVLEALPHPGSLEADEMIDELLAEYGHPANAKNAARAGYMAARRLLQHARQPLPAVDDAEPGKFCPASEAQSPAPAPASHDEVRKAFESEMRCEEVWGHRSLKRAGDGYVNAWVQFGWDVWQACAVTYAEQIARAERNRDMWREQCRNQAAELEKLRQVPSPAVGAEKLLRDSLRDAEWCDKRIHVCDGPVLQHWKVEVYLPIPADSGMSAEQALDRALGKSDVPVQPTGGANG